MKAFVLIAASLLLALPANADAPAENPVQAVQPTDPSIVKPVARGSRRCIRMSESWVKSTPRNTVAIVHMSFTIAADGTVKDAFVDASSGDADMDWLTLRCVEKWRYEPATKDGQPIEYPWSASVRFWHS
jgi:TonB family protein